MADWSFVTAFFILFYVFSLEYELNHKMPEFLRLVASVYNTRYIYQYHISNYKLVLHIKNLYP